MKKDNPGMKFLIREDDKFVAAPEEVNGIHMLSKLLLDLFTVLYGFNSDDEGKFNLVQSVVDNGINNEYTHETALKPLAAAVLAGFDIRKNNVTTMLNSRDRKHIEYGIRKELEAILVTKGLIIKEEKSDG